MKDAFIESVQQPLIKVCDRFNRLHLKEEKIQGLATTATAEQLEELFSYAKQVDSTLSPTDSTKVELSKKTNLKSFMSKHCRIRHYTFQIMKCMDETCCLEKRLPIEVFSSLSWIPDQVPEDDAFEKYLPYEEVVGTETTDKHRPSLGTGGNQIDSDRKDLLVSTRVRTTVTCWECFKPRCVYSRYVLTPAQLEEISCLECETWYTCGSPLSPSDDPSFVVREMITCSSAVEFSYYSCKRFKDVCAHCGNEECSIDTTLKNWYQTVLPICSDCESMERN